MLRTTTWTRGRRGAVTAASAAAVCLGGILGACAGSGGPGGGYVAVGGVGGAPGPGDGAGTPTGGVRMVPLDGTTPGNDRNPPQKGGASQSSTAPPSSGASAASGTPAPAGTATVTPVPSGSPSGSTGGEAKPVPSPPSSPPPGSPPPKPTAGHTEPATPADLTWGDPKRKATDQRWCEQVTVSFRNSGGTAVRSGTVTFGTHVIGALGIDWGTVESTADLPVPIGPGARTSPTWTVCVDAWRVPLGMHIETRDVSVKWK
ncbi:hypothetical protein [Streptomyces sp. NPDC002676]